MNCPNCGLQLHEQAVICPRCGYQPRANGGFYQGGYPQYQPTESNGIAIAALICAFLIPLVGLILGIVGLNKYKGGTYRKMCIWAIVLAPIVWLVNFVFSIVALLPALEAILGSL